MFQYVYIRVCVNMCIYVYYYCYINITNLLHRTSIHPSYDIFQIPGAVITGLWTPTLPKDEAILAHDALQVASACDTSLTNHGEPLCWWGLWKSCKILCRFKITRVHPTPQKFNKYFVIPAWRDASTRFHLSKQSCNAFGGKWALSVA